MKISKILDIPSVKILLFIQENEVRYTDLTKVITSRGVLSSNLKELEQEELLKRRVVTSKPIQAYYSLTKKGQKLSADFKEITHEFK